MIGRSSRQSSLFYFALAKDAAGLTDAVLDPLDPILSDPILVDFVAQALSSRQARSEDFGRPSIAPGPAHRVARSPRLLPHRLSFDL